MTSAGSNSVVVDTMVISWLVNHDPLELKDTYRELIGPATIVVPFQTVAELRFGAIRGGWGELRRRRLERSLADFKTARPDDAAGTIYARLKADCLQAGHPLWEKIHDGDRWIATMALRLGIPLVSHDKIFRDVPGLTLLTANS